MHEADSTGAGAGAVSAAAAAMAASRRAVRTSSRLLAAADGISRTSAELVAHAVYDIGELSSTRGLTLCGLLAGEEATVIPGMRWPDVDEQHRCEACAAEEQARPTAL